MFDHDGHGAHRLPLGSESLDLRRRGWPDVAHGGHVLRCWLVCTGGFLATACLTACLALALPVARPALLPLTRELLSWGLVPFAAGTLLVWRRTAAPMFTRLRERLYLGAALWAATTLAAVVADLLVAHLFASLTLSGSAALALGMGLVAPVLAFAVWPR